MSRLSQNGTPELSPRRGKTRAEWLQQPFCAVLCLSLGQQGPCPTLILPLAPELCPSQTGDQYPTLKVQTRSCAWPTAHTDQMCLAGLLQPQELLWAKVCRIHAAAQTGSQCCPGPPCPNQSVIWAQNHLPPPPNNYTEQISNSKKDPAKNRFKDRLLCCFPDNARMISCTKLLLCPHPISKQLMLHHY